MNDISVNGVSIKLADIDVLKNFSAVFPAGKVTCLMGESGCGKTTLLNILLGFLKPDSGTVTGMPEKISCVFQEDRLCEDHTALSNVRLVSDPEKAISCLSALGLGDSIRKPVKELSGGMKRRTATARALCADYELLILDEAFKGLDEETKRSVISTVREMAAGKTVISVTHDAGEASLFGAETVYMEKVHL